MPRTRLNPGFLLLLTALFVVDVAWGQCVMCKAVAETAQRTGVWAEA